ncbi:MAG: hypothetical protein SFV32_12745 [Opitutaceae bacterium]|nr:hypothetical protein [Opitutaceae bacterium]
MSNVLEFPYCELPDVQAEAQNTSIEDIPDFTLAINNASRYIDSYCRRDFLYHDNRSIPLLVAPSWCAENVIFIPRPTIELTKIELSDDNGITWTQVDPVHWTLVKVDGAASSRIAATFDWQPLGRALPRQIRLTGQFGYAKAGIPVGRTAENFNPDSVPSPDLPAEIRTACTVIAAVRSGKYRKDVISPDGQSRTITIRSIPDDVVKMLDGYRVSFL